MNKTYLDLENKNTESVFVLKKCYKKYIYLVFIFKIHIRLYIWQYSQTHI